MVLEEDDKVGRREVQRWGSATLLLPFVPLPLEKITVFRAGNELLWSAAIVCVIRFTPAGGGHDRGVVIIIIPERIETIAGGFVTSDEPGFLRFIFANEVDVAFGSGGACR